MKHSRIPFGNGNITEVEPSERTTRRTPVSDSWNCDFQPEGVLTGLRALPDVMKGYNVGAHYYITKPFKDETLLNVVEYLIGDLPPEEKRRRELLL